MNFPSGELTELRSPFLPFPVFKTQLEYPGAVITRSSYTFHYSYEFLVLIMRVNESGLAASHQSGFEVELNRGDV